MNWVAARTRTNCARRAPGAPLIGALAAALLVAACAQGWSDARPCASTVPVLAPEPTQSPPSIAMGMRRDPLATERWHRSPDGSVWTPHGHVTGLRVGRNKVLWIKPVGARLEITGRRLDGAAPPLESDLPDGYPGDYQSSSLVFGAAGCWDVRARVAGTSGDAAVLSVLIEVAPARAT